MNNNINRPWPNVSVIIPVYNGELTIRKCVESVLKSDYPSERMEILVIDDGSHDSTSRIVQDLQKESMMPIQIIRQENMGPALAKNTGFNRAKGEIIFLVSSDVYVSRNFIRLVSKAFLDKRVGISQGPLLRAGNTINCSVYHCTIQPKPTSHYVAAAIAYRAKAMDEAGRYFDERFSYCGDDTDLALRILEHGYEYRWVQDAKAYHELVPQKMNALANLSSALEVRKLVLLVKLHPQLRNDILVKHVFWPGWSKGRVASMSVVFAPILLYLLGIPAAIFFLLAWYLGLVLYFWMACYQGFKCPKKVFAYLPLVALFRIVNLQFQSVVFFFYSIKYRTLVI